MANKVGKHYKHKETEFWAENGLIYILDYRADCDDDERFNVETRATFAARAIAFNDQAKVETYKDEIYALNNLVVDMCQAIKEGKKQGDPMDPEAARKVAYDNRKLIFINNYNPDRRPSKLDTSLVHNYESSFIPDISSMIPKDAKIAGKDSAPERN